MMNGSAEAFGQVRFVSAVVLAAGCASRMGEQKMLLPMRGRLLVEWVADAALSSQASETIVVVGHQADAVTEALGDRALKVVRNGDYAAGMSTSIRAGLLAAAPGTRAAVFLLGDQPFVSSRVVDELIEAFHNDAWPIVRPSVDGCPANPVLIGATLFQELLLQEGDVGGRHVIERHPDDVRLVPMSDPLAFTDLDTRGDYERALDIDVGSRASRS